MLPLLPRTDTKGLRRLLLSAQARVAASRATPFESASEAALSAGAVPPAQAGGTRGMQSPCLPVPPGTRRSLRSRLRGFRAAKSPSHRETPVSFLRRRPTAFQRPLRRSQSPEATSAPPWGGREDSEKAGGGSMPSPVRRFATHHFRRCRDLAQPWLATRGPCPRCAAGRTTPLSATPARAFAVSRRKRWVAPKVTGQEQEDSHWQAMG